MHWKFIDVIMEIHAWWIVSQYHRNLAPAGGFLRRVTLAIRPRERPATNMESPQMQEIRHAPTHRSGYFELLDIANPSRSLLLCLQLKHRTGSHSTSSESPDATMPPAASNGMLPFPAEETRVEAPAPPIKRA